MGGKTWLSCFPAEGVRERGNDLEVSKIEGETGEGSLQISAHAVSSKLTRLNPMLTSG